MKTKKITWSKIKRVIWKNAFKSKTIMTFGTIGSCNLEHDVDIIVTKKPNAKSDEFYKDIHFVFEELNSFCMKKYGVRALRFARSEEEFIVKDLKEENRNSILFHTMVYHSMPQLVKDWAWALSQGDDIKKILRENYTPLIGKTEMLFSREFAVEKKYDNLFTFIYIYDKINSNYPAQMFLDVTRSNFHYLFKKRMGIETPAINSVEDAKKALYLLAGIIDRLNESSIGIKS